MVLHRSLIHILYIKSLWGNNLKHDHLRIYNSTLFKTNKLTCWYDDSATATILSELSANFVISKLGRVPLHRPPDICGHATGKMKYRIWDPLKHRWEHKGNRAAIHDDAWKSFRFHFDSLSTPWRLFFSIFRCFCWGGGSSRTVFFLGVRGEVVSNSANGWLMLP